MRKLKVIEYKVDENLNPIEFERDIFLHYSAKSVLLYEQMTGNKFYDDFNKAVRKLKTIEDGINKKKSDNATFNLLIDKLNAVYPCCYVLPAYLYSSAVPYRWLSPEAPMMR